MYIMKNNRNFNKLFLVSIFLFSHAAMSKPEELSTLKKMGKAFAEVAKKASPSVVFLEVEKIEESSSKNHFFDSSPRGRSQRSPLEEELLKRFFFGSPHSQKGHEPKRRVSGQGSGFIVSKDGYILTNNHVVSGADRIKVHMLSGKEFNAKIIGTDPHSDVAVIKVEATNLPSISLGDSDQIDVGEWVLALGNPFGLSHTLTAGIVSAKGRSKVGITNFENFIQTDAAINPGNSGGPLINLEGEVIGMNTAIMSRSGGYMGIGFAIPMNMVSKIKDQLIATGKVTRGFLGIIIQDLTEDLSKSFGLKDQNGIIIAQVSEGSPAEKAGFQQGDIIIELDGKTVKDVGSFRNTIALSKPDSERKIKVIRDKKEKIISAKIGSMPDDIYGGAKEKQESENYLGFEVRDLTNADSSFSKKDKGGVLVTRVQRGSRAAQAGLREGVVILELNRTKLQSASHFHELLTKTKENSVLLFLIEYNGKNQYISLSKKE